MRSRPSHHPHETVVRPRVLGVVLLTVLGLALVSGVAGWGDTPTARHPFAGPAGHRALRHVKQPRSVVSRSSGPVAAHVSVQAGRVLRIVPRSFLGLSTEYWTLPVDERHAAAYGRLLALVHAPGDGPLVLRIGGNSSDRSLYEPVGHRAPPWAFGLTPGWIARTAQVVRADHLRVIIDLNVITGSPRRAAAWVKQAERAFPRHSIIGLEIGNEPDLYVHSQWTQALGPANTKALALPVAITAESYARRYRAYARALARVAPHVPLLGPALAYSGVNADWISTLTREPHPRLGAISIHEYPYTACPPSGGAIFASVNRVLSPGAVGNVYNAVRDAARVAHGLPIRVTEFNSVTCSGRSGVSNTFATALWAPDALFAMLRAGAASADLHVRAYSVNAPVRFTTAGIRVRPLLFGLIVFTRMLGPGSRLVAIHVRAPSQLDLSTWAVRDGNGALKVLLIDKSRRSFNVALRLPGRGTASAQRLLAPAARSRRGVTLDGQHLTHQLQWRGRARTQQVIPWRGQYYLRIRRMSAVLVTLGRRSSSR